MLGKLDATTLNACLAAQDETQVRASAKEADDLGIEGTPALFVDGERINGALPRSRSGWLSIVPCALSARSRRPTRLYRVTPRRKAQGSRSCSDCETARLYRWAGLAIYSVMLGALMPPRRVQVAR